MAEQTQQAAARGERCVGCGQTPARVRADGKPELDAQGKVVRDPAGKHPMVGVTRDESGEWVAYPVCERCWMDTAHRRRPIKAHFFPRDQAGIAVDAAKRQIMQTQMPDAESVVREAPPVPNAAPAKAAQPARNKPS